MVPMIRDRPVLNRLIAVIVTAIAVIGTQLLGWEWGDGRLIPTVLGVSVAIVGVAYFLIRA